MRKARQFQTFRKIMQIQIFNTYIFLDSRSTDDTIIFVARINYGIFEKIYLTVQMQLELRRDKTPQVKIP